MGDMANDFRHGGLENCRPCLAVTDQGYGGFVAARATLPENEQCPRMHGVIRAEGVEFVHASSIRLYSPYSGYTGTFKGKQCVYPECEGAAGKKRLPIAW